MSPSSPALLVLVLASVSGLSAPTKLVVLSHGLYGGATNLQTLEDQLRLSSDVLVHQSASNEGRTRDGVAAGGSRLASEIRQVIAMEPSLRSLVLVGNSLGGLYVRYAAAELLEADSRMAGLDADALVTIGCPHLGVRRHTFIPLPTPVQAAGSIVAGRTAEDLLVRDASKPAQAPLL